MGAPPPPFPDRWLMLHSFHSLPPHLTRSGVNIAAQLVWVSLILEVFNDALIVPLYHCIGKTIADKRETAVRVRTGMLVVFTVYLALGVGIAGLAPWLVEWMAQHPDTHAQTVVYIRLEMLSVLLKALVDTLMVVFVLLGMSKQIWGVLLLQFGLTVFCDTIFLSSLPLSMQLGVNGIAFSNWAASGVTLGYAVCVTSRHFGWSTHSWLSCPRRDEFNWVSGWLSVGKYSGLDSFVRNVAYLLAILRMMNVLDDAGVYWLANSFIWTWLLLPIMPLADLMKRDASSPEMNHLRKTTAYYASGLGVCLVWFASMQYWQFALETVLNVPASEAPQVMTVVQTLLPFCK